MLRPILRWTSYLAAVALDDLLRLVMRSDYDLLRDQFEEERLAHAACRRENERLRGELAAAKSALNSDDAAPVAYALAELSRGVVPSEVLDLIKLFERKCGAESVYVAALRRWIGRGA